ncbi:methionine aminopeptidase, type I [Catenaria anguillulae PL171]|uniref:Methionine aminopeptidase n=1 Tax=Catenaria anguillulae PL171 TaxID=765915 RepID=A0A1Y2HBF4_9FUNG|nr:methionine aminopeptidase, type I [Catenaria anguillulae PL171]
MAMPAPEHCPPWAHDPNWKSDPRFSRNKPDILTLPEDRDKLRAAGRLAKAILNYAGSLVREGVTTLEINDKVHSEIVRRGAYPSPWKYQQFPKSICTSVNNVMCHGIPDSRPLKSGDIINIDITIYRSGFHGDCSATYTVGSVDAPGLALISATREALDAALARLEPGAPFSVIADAVMGVAHRHGFNVSPDMCGHGIGREFHSAPIVHHTRTRRAKEMRMVPGMAFTVEPILCQGSTEFVLHPDGWTAVTVDGGRSAQFEETVLVTEHGVEIVTVDETGTGS